MAGLKMIHKRNRGPWTIVATYWCSKYSNELAKKALIGVYASDEDAYSMAGTLNEFLRGNVWIDVARKHGYEAHCYYDVEKFDEKIHTLKYPVMMNYVDDDAIQGVDEYFYKALREGRR